MDGHTHIARAWINRARLRILHVVSWNISLSALFVPENLVTRDGFGSPAPRQLAHLHTQAESGAHLRDTSRVPRRRPFIHFKNATWYTSSGQSRVYRVTTQLRTDGVGCRESDGTDRASKSQGSSERVLPWQVTMDQLIFASLSHTHHWYDVAY